MAAFLAVLLATCSPSATEQSAASTASPFDQALPGEWVSYGRDYAEQRFSPLDQVNRETVGRLGVAWWAEFDTDRGQQATPLMAGGVLYTSTAWSKVFAFDARTGQKLWSYDPKVAGEKGFDACCDVVNRGVAIAGGRVFLGALDGRLIALDAKTGVEEWSVQTTDTSRPYTITGAPRVVKGLVLIGNGGADYGVRGYVSAYHANTGKLAWRFYTAPNPTGAPDGAASDRILKDSANATWSDGLWKEAGGGGTVWDAITYDEVNDFLLIGAGNGSPWNRRVRSGGTGDNLFLSSIVALKPETGEYVWHYQTTPGDSWDFTATQHIVVADLPIGGVTRRVVMQAPKNGFFYVLDAKTGKLLSAEKYVPVDWAERVDHATGRPVEAPRARYTAEQASMQTPGPLGGHNWQPMAFSPKESLVYIPTQIGPATYLDDPTFKFLLGAKNNGMDRSRLRPAAGARATGALVAWDPVAAKPRWTISFSQYWRSGVLATAGDLVFHAAGDEFIALDASNGNALWRYDTTASAIAPAMSYELDGVQYIALMVGWGGGGAMGESQPRRPGRLLVFKLDGTATPASYPMVFAPPPLDVTHAVPSQGDPARGQAAFNKLCVTCHTGSGYLPNLARSGTILDPDNFKAIVLDGEFKNAGMAGFRRFLDEPGAEDLRAFLLKQAASAMPEATPSSTDH